MNFHWPLVLWSLVIPFALLANDLLRRRKATTAPTASKIIQAEATRHSVVIGQWSFQRRAGKPRVRFALGLALAILALARPQWGQLEEPIFDQSREILIALDLSRSMTASDVTPTRLDRGKLLITSLLERLDGERVGLVVFAGTSFLQSPLSADYEILRDFLPALNPDFLPQGGSNYRALLETSLAAFGASGSADRFLVILSDGEATDDNWKPLADELKTKSIRIIGLGIGTGEGAMLPDGTGGFIKDERGAVVLSKLESATLQQLADTTNGVYTDASSWVDLAQLLNTTVETGRKGEFRERSRVRLAERFQWALAPALLFFVWSFWREFPVRPRNRDLRLKAEDRGQKAENREQPPATRAQPSALSSVPCLLSPVLFLTSALCLLSPVLCPLSSAAPAAPADSAATAAAPLSQLVGNFSARDALSGRDYAELATTTITYGERLQTAQQPVPAGPIHDALAAVEAGRTADAKAADWDDLRAKLEKFLQKPEQPPQQKPEDQKDQQDKKDDKQDKKDQQKSDDQKSDPSGQKPDDEQKSDSEKSQQPEEKKDQQSSKPESGEKKEPEKPGESAFGDMKKPEEKEPPQPQPQHAQQPEEKQQVGGAPDQKQTAPASPELAVPLQKLEQVRNQDSPGRLFQLMQDPQPKPEKKGKDW